LGFCLAALLFYGAVIEPGRLTVTTIDIREGRLAQILAGRLPSV